MANNFNEKEIIEMIKELQKYLSNEVEEKNK